MRPVLPLLVLPLLLLVACTGAPEDTADTSPPADTADTGVAETVLRAYDPACDGFQFGGTAPVAGEDDDWIIGRIDPAGEFVVDAVRAFVLHTPGDGGCDASGAFEVIVFRGPQDTAPGSVPAEHQRFSLAAATPAGSCGTDTCRVLEVDLDPPVQVDAGIHLWVALQAYYVSADERSCFAKCTGPSAPVANQWSTSSDPDAWVWTGLSDTVLWAEAIDRE